MPRCSTTTLAAAPSRSCRFDEDYGFVTVEAFAAGKPVVTCSDSGGPTELVTDGVTGRVTPATASAVAAALAEMMADRTPAERMGTAARARGAMLTWPATVARLLGTAVD